MAPNTEDNYKQFLDWCFKNTKILELKDNSEKSKGLIHIASEKGLTQLVAKLLEEGIDVNTEDSFKQTSLHLASKNGHLEVVDLLLQQKRIDVNHQDDKKMTALHYSALFANDTDITELLLQNGAHVNCRDNQELTPLHRTSNKDVVMLLLQHGAKNELEKKSFTPLHLASQDGETEIAKLLLDHGADVNCKSEYEWTPLHVASFRGDNEIVDLLIQNGAQVNSKNKAKSTPLHEAVQHEKYSDMLNMKALVGIRIILMGKEYE